MLPENKIMKKSSNTLKHLRLNGVSTVFLLRDLGLLFQGKKFLILFSRKHSQLAQKIDMTKYVAFLAIFSFSKVKIIGCFVKMIQLLRESGSLKCCTTSKGLPVSNAHDSKTQWSALTPRLYKNKSNSTASGYKWQQICKNSLMIVCTLEN